MTFFSYIAQSFAPALYGQLSNTLNATANPRVYGYVVFAAMLIGSVASNLFYWKAGKAYEKAMEGKDVEGATA